MPDDPVFSQASDPITFPIVGIGASAGGLAALEAFLSGLPKDLQPNMAFVLVQHLAPDHSSSLVELLGRHTHLEVLGVEDGVTVRPNCIFVIPPNREMALLNGSLQLLQPVVSRGPRLGIDFFFRSLAEDQRERAICVVLSGTGSDGTLGARAVKGEGGLVVAQSPETAAYDGMPRSVIGSGVVDVELPPQEIPEFLFDYLRARERPLHPSPRRGTLQKIFVILRLETGHDFSQYKLNTVERRLERRMAVHQIEKLEDYLFFLQKSAEEVNALFRDLLIGVTRFFRDEEAFQAVAETVLPELFAGANPDATLRVWVPGCSTGEEAYSIAILLFEAQSSLNSTLRFQVFATDIDSDAIADARRGRYSTAVAGDISKERLNRFFTVETDVAGDIQAYTVRKSVRDLLIFSEQDLVRDPPFSKLDLISCRNLLIYMSNSLQKKLVPLFHYALNSGGHLFLGTSETIGEFDSLFTTRSRRFKIFRKNDRTELSYHHHPGFTSKTRGTLSCLPKKAPTKGSGASLRELTEGALLEQLVCAAALVTREGDILYIHGRTGMYLEPASGEVGVNNIVTMAREGLRRDLSLALRKAGMGQTTRRLGLVVKTNGGTTRLDLTVRPVAKPSLAASAAPVYLVVLEESPSVETPPTAEPDASDPNTRVVALEQELRYKEEQLHTTTEELNSANEELRSSVEEMQSINEELQSTNEELETSKEELQSVNEELSTVNAELENKVTDLSRTNDDMRNLLAGTGIATVFLDTRLRILRFTPSATRIIHLIPGDVGRPVGHIVANLVDYPTLVEDVQEVLDTLIAEEKTVRTAKGERFSMRILPYRTLDNVIEGVVLTFVEISPGRAEEQSFRLNSERLEAALRAFPIVVANQDLELRYTWVYNTHPGWLDLGALGKRDSDLLAEDVSGLTELKRDVLMTGVGRSDIFRTTLSGVPFSCRLAVEPLRGPSADIIGITCVSIESDLASLDAGTAKLTRDP